MVVGGSRIRSEYQDRGIQFDTTLESLNQIKALPVKIESSITSLGYLADIKMSERTEGELVRIDGKSCVTVSIKKSTLANEIKLSSAIRRVLDLYAREVPECDYKILYDNGQEQFKLLKKVLLFLAKFITDMLQCKVHSGDCCGGVRHERLRPKNRPDHSRRARIRAGSQYGA